MNKRILVILIFFCLFVGCNPNTTETTEPTRGIFVTRTPSMVIATKPTITPTPFLAATPSQTWTPLPTLTYNDGMQILKVWFESTDYCRLPCWAGINPGQTGWEESWHILQPLQQTVKLEAGSNVDCIYGKCSFISWSRTPNERGVLSSIYPENVIDYIMLETIEPNHLTVLSLQNILSIYGKPTILLFSTEPEQPGQKYLALILVYPERQFLIRYSRNAEISGNTIESCGSDDGVKLIILDNQEQLASIDAIANAVETKEFNVDVWHKSVEETMGMTIDEFYKTFREPNAPCISTPVKVWQP